MKPHTFQYIRVHEESVEKDAVHGLKIYTCRFNSQAVRIRPCCCLRKSRAENSGGQFGDLSGRIGNVLNFMLVEPPAKGGTQYGRDAVKNKPLKVVQRYLSNIG